MNVLHHTLACPSNDPLNKLYISQNGLTNRIIAHFLPDSFPTATYPASSHLFNNGSTGSMTESNICHLSCPWWMRLDLPDPISYWLYRSLKATSNYGITIKCTEIKLHLHCDASWASHHDGNSHTVWVLKMGKSHLGCKIRKWRGGSPSLC